MKKPEIRPEMKSRLKHIEWLRHCGDHFNVTSQLEIVSISSWAEAKKYHQSSDWDDTILEARNLFVASLSENCESELKHWNKITRSVRHYLNAEVLPELKVAHPDLNLGDNFVGNVQWNLLAAVMEDIYRECQLDSPRFFSELLNIYEAGHLPCGWIDGNWPIGKLIVL